MRRLYFPEKNGAAYWIANCIWEERHSEDAVRTDNFNQLIRLSSKESRQLLPEHVDVLLNELRAWAKTAGDAKWEPNREMKIITRQALLEWWERRAHELVEGASTPSGGKLRKKMADAGLPTELAELAAVIRRDYAAVARTSRYMEPDEGERLQHRVNSEVMSLQARVVAGQLDLDGPAFHSLCLDRMDAVNAERPPGHNDQSAFLRGCMYDITDRCLLRFARPTR